MLHLLFKKTSFLFQNDLSHCSASSIVFFSASAVTGVMRYLVLKSNGLRHSENLPVKFGFSPQIVPANIVKKLPSQRCPQPFLIAFFNFSHKWPTFAFTGESGYTLGFRRKIAHSGSHAETGAFPPRPQHSLELPAKSSPKEQPEEADARLWRVSASSGVAAPLGYVIFFCFCQNCGLHTMCSVLSTCARRGVVSPLLVCSACCRNSRPPLVKTTNLPFSEIG